MKYKEIKVGESYVTSVGYKIEVISKEDYHKAVMTIDEDGDVLGWNQYELKQFQPIKKELSKGGLLVHKDKDDLMIYRTGDVTGFGFNSFGFYEDKDIWSFIICPKHWRTATPEEEAKFIEMLKAEAEKRGLRVNAKIKGHADGDNEEINKNLYIPSFRAISAWNKNGQIFHEGIWAEPLTMLDEVCDAIKKHLPNVVVEMIDGVVTLKQL